MENKTAFQKLINWEPYFHCLFWCMVLFYPFIKYMGKEGGYPMSFLHELNSLFFKMAISYFLYFWYFPKEKKRKLLPIMIIAFILNTLGYVYFDDFFHSEVDYSLWLSITSSTLTYLGFGILFFALHTLKSSYKKELQINQLNEEKRNAEISLLKAKVNPHFLFNTLNTIYASSLKKDEKTPDLILKLSDGFRYILHAGQKEFVTIGKELQHIKDYMVLQEERLAKKVKVYHTIAVDDNSQPIAPLLLIGFIENAFKYTSILKGEQHEININISLEHKKLLLHCNNPYKENNACKIDMDWKESGIGLKNTRQRLALLYPHKHRLKIQKKNSFFEVILEIQL